MLPYLIDRKSRNFLLYFLTVILSHILGIIILDYTLGLHNNFSDKLFAYQLVRKYEKPIMVKFRRREVIIEDDDIIEVIKKKKRKELIKETKPILIPMEFEKRYIDLVYEKIEENKFYPEIEKERGHQGEVLLKFTILKNGAVKYLKILKGCPFKNLNYAAMETIKSSIPFPPLYENLNELDIIVNVAYELE